MVKMFTDRLYDISRHISMD